MKPKKPLPKEAERYKFKKGVSGNPEGARAHNPALKALRKITIESYRKIIELILAQDIDALKAMTLNKELPALEVGIARAFFNAINKGDYHIIEKIAERIIGKIPDELNVNAHNVNANLNASLDPAKLKAAVDALRRDV